ncbi:hypothetical protein GmHk_U059958 [Glycine max]|nr:hypothetical protein GmHk_U059958 [Glycine max]
MLQGAGCMLTSHEHPPAVGWKSGFMAEHAVTKAGWMSSTLSRPIKRASLVSSGPIDAPFYAARTPP